MGDNYGVEESGVNLRGAIDSSAYSVTKHEKEQGKHMHNNCIEWVYTRNKPSGVCPQCVLIGGSECGDEERPERVETG